MITRKPPPFHQGQREKFVVPRRRIQIGNQRCHAEELWDAQWTLLDEVITIKVRFLRLKLRAPDASAATGAVVGTFPTNLKMDNIKISWDKD